MPICSKCRASYGLTISGPEEPPHDPGECAWLQSMTEEERKRRDVPSHPENACICYPGSMTHLVGCPMRRTEEA